MSRGFLTVPSCIGWGRTGGGFWRMDDGGGVVRVGEERPKVDTAR